MPYISGTIHRMIFTDGTHVKYDNISRFFFIYFKFLFLGSIVGWCERAKNGKMAKRLCLSYSISQEACIIWLSILIHICKMMISSDGPKWQKFCLSHSVHQELYIIWLWFLVQMCKMMISPASFFIFFKILIFWVFRGRGKRAKNDP